MAELSNVTDETQALTLQGKIQGRLRTSIVLIGRYYIISCCQELLMNCNRIVYTAEMDSDFYL